MSSEIHHIIPVMFASFVIVFRYIFLSLSFSLYQEGG